MKKISLSRRKLLFGAGSFLLGGATAAVVGITFRDQIRQVLGSARPTTERLSQTSSADDGWLITADERQALEAADEHAESSVLTLRESVDLLGGDVDQFRVESLQNCVSACEAQTKCDAFTYARASHPIESKRRMCWLKSGVSSSSESRASHYVSGRRGPW